MDKAVIIANPAASQFTGGSHREVMSILSQVYQAEASWPGSGPDASVAAAQAVEEGAGLVVAMGGDGLVHHVAQGVVGSGTPMGVIPVGTTNVVSRLLELPSSPSKAARVLTRPAPSLVSGTARIELSRGAVSSTHHALFACGFGLDADVVTEADKDPYKKYRFGSIHYARTALRVALGSFPKVKPHVVVSSGEREALVSGAVTQFRSIYTYFGRIPLSLGTDRPDPMTVLLMERLRRRRVPAIAGRLLARRPLEGVAGLEIWENITSFRAKADPPVAVQADGEALGMADEVSVSWAPDSIRLIRGGQPSP